jgi:hypothetical protein
MAEPGGPGWLSRNNPYPLWVETVPAANEKSESRETCGEREPENGFELSVGLRDLSSLTIEYGL